MHVQFNRPATVAGVTYGKGVHDVPDDARKDWFFEALRNAGDLQVLSGSVPVAVPVNLSDQAAKEAATVLRAAKDQEAVENSKKK
jgi:hypothetical protein